MYVGARASPMTSLRRKERGEKGDRKRMGFIIIFFFNGRLADRGSNIIWVNSYILAPWAPLVRNKLPAMIEVAQPI